MTLHPLHDDVAALMREAADEFILPRFRALAAHEIAEKSPGEVVTVADHESEERLQAGLAKLLPEARFVGEEACEADSALLDDLGEGTLWLVDPLDGTTNFAEGITPFAVMAALVEDGEAMASWILDPASGRICHAHRGHGAFVDGERIRSKPTGRELPVAALAMHFLSPERRAELESRAAGNFEVAPIPRCAGEQYPRLALGENDISVFERTLPWDHAPGALFLAEAGGRTAHPDGSPYGLGVQRPGLLSAATPELWDRAAKILFG